MQNTERIQFNERLKKEVVDLLKNYRGLREEDLHPLNLRFSCVLCGYYTCKYHNKPMLCCFKQQPITEREWLKFYDLFGQGDEHVRQTP